MGNCNCIDERADKDIHVDGFAPSTVKMKAQSQNPGGNDASATSFELIQPHTDFDGKPDLGKPTEATFDGHQSQNFQATKPTARAQAEAPRYFEPAPTADAAAQPTFGQDAMTFNPRKPIPTSFILTLQTALRIVLAKKKIRSDENRLTEVPDPADAREEQVSDVSRDPDTLLTREARQTMNGLPPFRYTYSVKGVIVQPPRLLSDRSIYIGQWGTLRSGGLYRKGKGKLYRSDGSYCEGYWLGSSLQSPGRMIYLNGDYYEGGLRTGMRQGSGMFRSFDGKTEYNGSWIEDMKHGNGNENCPDGSTYSGEFARDKRSGFGKLNLPDGKTYDGQFLSGKYDGRGTHTWRDGRKYEGDWRNGLMHGRGKFISADGKVYEGDYVNDKKHGKGVFKWDGKIYDGDWVDGKMHGKGYLTTDKGRKFYEFKDNERGREIKE